MFGAGPKDDNGRAEPQDSTDKVTTANSVEGAPNEAMDDNEESVSATDSEVGNSGTDVNSEGDKETASIPDADGGAMPPMGNEGIGPSHTNSDGDPMETSDQPEDGALDKAFDKGREGLAGLSTNAKQWASKEAKKLEEAALKEVKKLEKAAAKKATQSAKSLEKAAEKKINSFFFPSDEDEEPETPDLPEEGEDDSSVDDEEGDIEPETAASDNSDGGEEEEEDEDESVEPEIGEEVTVEPKSDNEEEETEAQSKEEGSDLINSNPSDQDDFEPEVGEEVTVEPPEAEENKSTSVEIAEFIKESQSSKAQNVVFPEGLETSQEEEGPSDLAADSQEGSETFFGTVGSQEEDFSKYENVVREYIVPSNVDPLDKTSVYEVQVYVRAQDEQPEHIAIKITDKETGDVLAEQTSFYTGEKLFVVTLPPGDYEIEMKDKEGNVMGSDPNSFQIYVNEKKVVDAAGIAEKQGFSIQNSGSGTMVKATA